MNTDTSPNTSPVRPRALSLNQLVHNPSCMDDYDPNAMSVAQAQAYIQQFLTPIQQTEITAIMLSLGRVLAETIVSPCNVPNHNNSAMDGFAFRHQDASQPLRIIGTAFAGRPFSGQLNRGECVKIMTGAVIPVGADTVVMQEHTQVDKHCMTITTPPKLAANIRLAGEDLTIGQTVLEKGHRLQPADLGLLASLGVASVSTYRTLKVAFFSTGDELSPVGTLLKEGQIYDSNRYTIYGMLSKLGVEITDLGAVPDNPLQLESTLLQAASAHDAVITSGGVSVGEADHMKALLAKHGQVLFWKINMKPGRPLAYGKIGNAHYFGLPGNPVATMVTFYQFVRNALLQIMGAQPKTFPTFKVECTQAIKKAVGRIEFQRGLLFDVQGVWKVKPLGNQSSGVLSSMSFANCFIVLAETVGHCDAGQMVDVQPFEGII
jgi:molybdopterin molybdotransferase